MELGCNSVGQPVLREKHLQPQTQATSKENYSLHSQDSQTFEKAAKRLLLQFLHSPSCAWSMRQTLTVLLHRNAAGPGTPPLPQLAHLWNNQPFCSPSLGVIHCQLSKPCGEHRSTTAVTAERTRLSPELQFSIAAKADGEIRFFSIDPIVVASPGSYARTVPVLGACLTAPHYLRHPGTLLNAATALACSCWDGLQARSPRYWHLLPSLLGNALGVVRRAVSEAASVCTNESWTKSRAGRCWVLVFWVWSQTTPKGL